MYPPHGHAPYSRGLPLLLGAVFAALAFALGILLDSAVVETKTRETPPPGLVAYAAATNATCAHPAVPSLPAGVALEACAWLVAITAIAARVSLSLEEEDTEAKRFARMHRRRLRRAALIAP
ncbi:hypothetical protein Q8F55_008947 [Vanrija albida]|uniref:Uncharacterized protein n=1 Tax=Vanrija albida TaxID=181172 RepID=A0ABR3PSH0_9TREE